MNTYVAIAPKLAKQYDVHLCFYVTASRFLERRAANDVEK